MAQYSEKQVATMHQHLDNMLELGMTVVVAGKEPKGGYMYGYLGDKRSVKALISKLSQKLWGKEASWSVE